MGDTRNYTSALTQALVLLIPEDIKNFLILLPLFFFEHLNS